LEDVGRGTRVPKPQQLVREVGQDARAEVALAGGVGVVEGGVPEAAGRGVAAFVEMLPGDGLGEGGGQGVQPLFDGAGVAALADEVGDGGQVRVEQAVGVLPVFGGKADQFGAAVLQPGNHLGVGFTARGEGREPAGLGDGPLVGEGCQGAAGVGEEGAAVQGGH
jgi:hypothetical protein